ncbi:hypothetical protein ACMATS_01295 [Streptoverticillium reticulum]|uniref:hypothetical protein n=1 Tax=Streptoverticillium reticulum TaxID=1433415 RepID=UPI0039BF3CCB
MSRKAKATLVAAGAVALGLAITAALWPGDRDAAPGPPSRPETAVVHDSTANPKEVEEHWTPERIRQSDENMRHATGKDD